jgi:hypothetical protein
LARALVGFLTVGGLTPPGLGLGRGDGRHGRGGQAGDEKKRKDATHVQISGWERGAGLRPRPVRRLPLIAAKRRRGKPAGEVARGGSNL